MRKRRVSQVSSEDDEPSPPADDRLWRKKRRVRHVEDEEDAERSRKCHETNGGASHNGVGEVESEEDVDEEDSKAEPLGEILSSTGKGKKKKNHYESFELEGNVPKISGTILEMTVACFRLQEDSVLLTPEDLKQKPYVAIIKDITEDVDGNLMVTGQWFYRPEEAEKKGGGNWQPRDTRELFYSFHRDDVPAESVMHKCVKVYDAVEKKLWKLTDKDYEDGKQHEIDLLVQKTRERLGELPDLELEESAFDQHDQPNLTTQSGQIPSKWNLRRKNLASIDAQRGDFASSKFDTATKAETPGSCTGDLSEYDAILKKFNALTRDLHRDKWLKKLLQAIQTSCKGFTPPSDQNAAGNIDALSIFLPPSSGTFPSPTDEALPALGRGIRRKPPDPAADHPPALPGRPAGGGTGRLGISRPFFPPGDPASCLHPGG
ncbi:hypothetical protein KSP40_PGU019944 [Platanthera guangdongensis]|uniref:BAH domain-containing protein n=1 Tax=Platanthera guangdongensis TaxID=2320717 RepID=A0ABR2MK59_9ASPA